VDKPQACEAYPGLRGDASLMLMLYCWGYYVSTKYPWYCLACT
jgi:hypothetical protein